MAFGEYFDAFSKLGASIGSAFEEPAKTRLALAEKQKELKDKDAAREAIGKSPLIRDKALASALYSATGNLPAALIRGERTGGGGGGGSSILNAKRMFELNMMSLTEKIASTPQLAAAITDPVARAELDEVQQKMVNTYLLHNKRYDLLQSLDKTYDEMMTNIDKASDKTGIKSVDVNARFDDFFDNTLAPSIRESGLPPEEQEAILDQLRSDPKARIKFARESLKTTTTDRFENFLKSVNTDIGRIDERVAQEDMIYQAIVGSDVEELEELLQDADLDPLMKQTIESVILAKMTGQQVEDQTGEAVVPDLMGDLTDMSGMIDRMRPQKVSDRLMKRSNYKPKPLKKSGISQEQDDDEEDELPQYTVD